MPSFVITWKPERWPYDEIIKLVRAHTSGMPAKSSWRFRAHRRGALGDRVFLLKQGTPRGIFGTGTIIELPDQTAETEGEKSPVALIAFDRLVDPFITLLLGEREIRSILPESIINTQFSGAPITDDAALALMQRINQAAAEGNARSLVPTAERFAEALARMEAEGRLSTTDRQMLICHYNADAHTLTGRQMSERMGWRGQAANNHYGTLGRRLAEELDWVPTEREGYDGFDVSALMLGSRPNGDFEWTMRPQLARALELLGWPELVWFDRTSTSQPSEAETHDEILEGFEGAEKHYFVRHRHREARLRRRKLDEALRRNNGRLLCEVPNCGFDFAARYGDLGVGYAQVHHKEQLSEAPKEGRKVALDDLAVVCGNCHVMIHIGGACRPLEGLIPLDSE